MDKIINYGISLVNEENKDVTHFITSIHINSVSHIATFIIENGINVQQLKISMDEAQKLGIINIQKLIPFIK